MSNETLRECPFCGAQPEYDFFIVSQYPHEIYCDKCIGIASTQKKTLDEARAAWNRRTVHPPQVDDEQLREALAEYAHEAWSGWMKYLFTNGERGYHSADGTWVIRADYVDRWTRQMNTPYADLPESEKASDREEADKMLALIRRTVQPPQEGKS